MKLSILVLGLMLSAASQAAPFQTRVTTTIAVNQDLATCKAPFLAYRDCNFKTDVYSTMVHIEDEYALGTGTHIEVKKNFAYAEGQFVLKIAGTAYPLDNEPVQSFPFPSGTKGQVTLTLSAVSDNVDSMPKAFQSMVTSIVVVEDGSAYVKLQLDSLKDLADQTESAEKYYNLQKSFVRYFKKSDADIRTLKEDLTGRSADDLTTDCQKAGNGNPDPLDPDTCQQLRIFNDYLSGRNTGISEDEKQKAFSDFQTKTHRLEAALHILKEALISYDDRYNKVLETAINLILIGA